MKTSDVAVVAATLMSPFIAIYTQGVLERRRQAGERRVQVFRILTATRAAKLSPEHVQALNSIDVEFYEPNRYWKQRKLLAKVLSVWHTYRDNLFAIWPVEETEQSILLHRRGELFSDLLVHMATATGYDFDVNELRKLGYSPQAQEIAEAEQAQIRRGLAAVLSGKYGLPVEAVVANKLSKPEA